MQLQANKLANMKWIQKEKVMVKASIILSTYARSTKVRADVLIPAWFF